LKKLFVLIAVLFITVQISADKPLKWYSFNEGMAKAKSEHKLLLVDFYTDWCGWCKKMDAVTYEDKAVKKLLNDKFIVAKLNPEKQGTVTYNGKNVSNGQFAKAAQVTGYPTTGFFKNDSVFIGKVSGYFGPKQFIKILHGVIDAKESGKE